MDVTKGHVQDAIQQLAEFDRHYFLAHVIFLEDVDKLAREFRLSREAARQKLEACFVKICALLPALANPDREEMLRALHNIVMADLLPSDIGIEPIEQTRVSLAVIEGITRDLRHSRDN